jgi:NitT/TauT family transport system ATP-binding protein
MDEPFGPLDAQTRLTLQALLLRIWETTRPTVLFVTHDLVEAIALADRVLLMSARPGRILRDDRVDIPRPRDVFFIHDNPVFRTLHDGIWHELAREVQDVAPA